MTTIKLGRAVETFVVRGNDPRLIAGIVSADSQTLVFVRLIAQALADLKKVANNKKRAKLCLACDHAFLPGDEPPAFLLVTPFIDGEQAVVSPICAHCAEKTDEDLVRVFFNHWRKTNPDLRWLPSTPPQQ